MMEPVDWLIVFNQNFPLEAIKQLVLPGRKAVILTSHQLLEHELEFVSSLGLTRADVLTFSDLLSDAELEAIDSKVSATLMQSSSAEFMPRFSEGINYEKNACAFSKLSSRFSFGEIHACCGLGISARFWKEKNARLYGEVNEGPSLGLVDRLVAKAVDLGRKIQVNLVRTDHVEYVFFGPIKRLRFMPGISIEPHVVRNAFGGYARFLRQRRKRGAVVASTTIHGFTDPQLLTYPDLHVFVDGFHPPNYSRSYIDLYGNSIFVTRTMFDNLWFSRNGKRTIKLPAVIRKETMREVVSTGEVNTIVALLNHAGDWTALINRSDTDRLVNAVVKLARAFPHKRFIIRLHPTMIHKDHEGVDSIQRIRFYVAWARLANLSVSQVELQEDFDRGDLFISEYSQTVIDAATMGKRVVIANFTGRRSFMACYEEIGFPSVSNHEQLQSWLEGVFRSTAQCDQQQNQAVRLYNRMLDVYLASQ